MKKPRKNTEITAQDEQLKKRGIDPEGLKKAIKEAKPEPVDEAAIIGPEERVCLDEVERFLKQDAWALGCAPVLVNAYFLVRCSDESQALRTSIRRQMEKHKEACMLRTWTFDESRVVKDIGVSAFDGSNLKPDAEFGRFCLMNEQGLLLPNRVLIVENPDRLSRAMVYTAESVLYKLIRNGCAVLFLSNGLLFQKGDENDPIKTTILKFEFDRAHRESLRKSALILAAFKLKLDDAKAGKIVDLGPWSPSWVKFVDGPKPHYAFTKNKELVEEIIQLVLEKQVIHHVSEDLNRRRVHLLTYGNGTWGHKEIFRIITNPALRGIAKFKGIEFKDYYPELVNEATWNKLQAIAAPKMAGGGKHAGWYTNTLFPGLTKCPICGGSMRSRRLACARFVSKQYANRYTYYTCRGHSVGTGCQNNGNLRTLAIELDFFGAYLQKSPTELLFERNEELQNKVNVLRGKVAKSTEAIKRLTALQSAMQDVSDYEEGTEAIKALVAQRKLDQNELQKLYTSSAENMGAEFAWRQLVRTITGLPEVKTLHGEVDPAAKAALNKLNEMGLALQKQLLDGKYRERLATLTPQYIRGLLIDTKGYRYGIRTIDGKIEWRNLEPILAALKAAGEARQREGRRKYWETISPEKRAAHTAKLAAALRKYWDNLEPGERKAKLREYQAMGSEARLKALRKKRAALARAHRARVKASQDGGAQGGQV